MVSDNAHNVVFSATGVTKRYGHFCALDNLTMQLRRGKIYGFIGENGAGKTTTIRIMAGLSRLSEGGISLFGRDDEKGLRDGRARTGFLIESPAVYENMTGAQNLEIQCLLRSLDSHAWIARTMELAGLKSDDRRSVKNYSLGMKQRLGLAIALLGEPEFLVLDEPINGLDPSGVHEMRSLLESLNRDRGVTMLISSHILSELSQTATDFIFLKRGRVLNEFSKDEFMLRRVRIFNIVTDDQVAAGLLLSRIFPEADLSRDAGGAIVLSGKIAAGTGEMARLLSEGGLEVDTLTCKDESLEDYFLKTVGDDEV